MLKMNNKRASLGFGEINKVASSVFGEVKIKIKKLPVSSVFQKSGLINTCLFLAISTHFQA